MNTFSQTISNFKNEKKQNEKKIKKKRFFYFPTKKVFQKKNRGEGEKHLFHFTGFYGQFYGN